MHKRKLRQVKSSIREQYQTAGAAQKADKLRNGKKEAMMERKLAISLILTIERYTEIERENRILLEKMSNIMQKKPSMSTNSIAQQFAKRTLNGD